MIELFGLLNKRFEHVTVRTSTFVLCGIAALHVFQAVLICIYADAARSTPMKGLFGFFDLFGLAIVPILLATIMIVAASLGAAGAVLHLGKIRLVLFAPQTIILGIQAGGAITAIAVGHYLDGTKIAAPHIATDQAYVCLVFAAYLHAALRRSRFGA